LSFKAIEYLGYRNELEYQMTSINGVSISLFHVGYETAGWSEPLHRLLSPHSPWRRKVLSNWFGVGAIVMGVGQMGVVLLLLTSVYTALCRVLGEEGGGPELVVTPLIPGVTLSSEHLFSFWTGALLVLTVHELGHAAAACTERLQIQSCGVFFALLFPGAFVRVEDSVQYLPTGAQLRIYCAGVWNNLVLCLVLYIICLLLPPSLLLAYSHTLSLSSPGAVVTHVSPESALVSSIFPSDVITAVNGETVMSASRYYQAVRWHYNTSHQSTRSLSRAQIHSLALKYDLLPFSSEDHPSDSLIHHNSPLSLSSSLSSPLSTGFGVCTSLPLSSSSSLSLSPSDLLLISDKEKDREKERLTRQQPVSCCRSLLEPFLSAGVREREREKEREEERNDDVCVWYTPINQKERKERESNRDRDQDRVKSGLEYERDGYNNHVRRGGGGRERERERGERMETSSMLRRGPRMRLRREKEKEKEREREEGHEESRDRDRERDREIERKDKTIENESERVEKNEDGELSCMSLKDLVRGGSPSTSSSSLSLSSVPDPSLSSASASVSYCVQNSDCRRNFREIKREREREREEEPMCVHPVTALPLLLFDLTVCSSPLHASVTRERERERERACRKVLFEGDASALLGAASVDNYFPRTWFLELLSLSSLLCPSSSSLSLSCVPLSWTISFALSLPSLTLSFLHMLFQLSLSVAVINLLPVYVSDGGLACPHFCRLFFRRGWNMLSRAIISLTTLLLLLLFALSLYPLLASSFSSLSLSTHLFSLSSPV